MPVEPDHVYIIPPNKDLEIIDGVLALMPRKPKPHIHLPIDQFFLSLAERQKDGAIAILLSGMGSDGTLGMKAIKVAGGITFVQDSSAVHSGMTQAAIREGVVDSVLSPQEIATELGRLSKLANIFQLTKETTEAANVKSLNDNYPSKDLEKILVLVKTAVGVDFSRYKKTTISRRIVRRMLLYKLDTLADYIVYLKKNPQEAAVLYADLLINVTYFFRDEQTMAHLKKQVLPTIIKSKKTGQPLRIWVAACSTGQEAYSMAMIIIEILGENIARVPVQIFATDLSEAAISKARSGIYRKSEVKDISQSRLNRFFAKTEDQYRINKLARDICVFAPHNLLNDPPFSKLDFVSCRNLLIYLDDLLQNKALATFHYGLNPDGLLLLGKSESVGSSSAHFLQTDKEFKIFLRKNSTPARIPREMTVRKNNIEIDQKALVPKSSLLLSPLEMDKLVDQWLLSHHVPACIVIDQDMEILQFRGSTSMFLEPSPGKASLNLTKMARPLLLFDLRSLIHKAKKSAKPARKSGIKISVKEQVHYVDLQVVPLTNPANQQLFLILFEEVPKPMVAVGQERDQTAKHNQLLESEMAALQQDMHSLIEEQEAVNEELQSTNEEVVSSNEELQSINEELETSKEEIESANEELLTINQELLVRNNQLSESYEYSEAILSTINEATLVLDNQLHVRSANRAFYKIFNTDPLETEGVLIYELCNRQLDFKGFRQLINNLVTQNTLIKGFEVKIKPASTNEHIMQIHARRALQDQKQIILLVFEDITEYRKSQMLLMERQQWFEALVDNAMAMIWVTDVNGKISFLNKAWLEFTGQSFSSEREFSIIENIHPDDRQTYLQTLATGMAKKNVFTSEYRVRRRDGEYRWILDNTKPMFSSAGQFNGYIGTCTDIHTQKL
jgi:two-component system CheB/CheR fusion protein